MGYGWPKHILPLAVLYVLCYILAALRVSPHLRSLSVYKNILGNSRKYPYTMTDGLFGIPRARGGSLNWNSKGEGRSLNWNSEGMGEYLHLEFWRLINANFEDVTSLQMKQDRTMRHWWWPRKCRIQKKHRSIWHVLKKLIKLGLYVKFMNFLMMMFAYVL